MRAGVIFFAIAIFAPSTSVAMARMSFVLLLKGIAKIRSAGVASRVAASVLYSASASAVLPLPASAMPREKCQKAVAAF